MQQDDEFLARLKAQITGLQEIDDGELDPDYRNLFLGSDTGRRVLKDLATKMYFSSYGLTADHMRERNSFLGILKLCGVGGGDILDAILTLQGVKNGH